MVSYEETSETRIFRDLAQKGVLQGKSSYIGFFTIGGDGAFLHGEFVWQMEATQRADLRGGFGKWCVQKILARLSRRLKRHVDGLTQINFYTVKRRLMRRAHASHFLTSIFFIGRVSLTRGKKRRQTVKAKVVHQVV